MSSVPHFKYYKFKAINMTRSIDILLPSGTISYTEGIANVSHIQIKYYFANVVDIYIHITGGEYFRYLQVPCVYHYIP